MGALTGIKVIDFTRVLSGPFATMLLADLGATVIKVERPGTGDENRFVRRFEGRRQEDEDYFYPMNRSKKSVVLDLQSDEGRATALSLIAGADVVAENFSPGVVDRLGIGPDQARRVNSRVIYCSISGFGQKGLRAHHRAYDGIIQALAGTMALTGYGAEGAPLRPGMMLADVFAGMFAAASIEAALLRRKSTGRGAVIDTAMADALLSVWLPHLDEYCKVPLGRMACASPIFVPSNVYYDQSGQALVVSIETDPQWIKLAEVIGLTPQATQKWGTPAFRRTDEARGEIDAILTSWIRRQTAQSAYSTLQAADVPCGPLSSVADWFEGTHAHARNMLLNLRSRRGLIRVINSAFHSSPELTDAPTEPPVLGEHQDELTPGTSTPETQSTETVPEPDSRESWLTAFRSVVVFRGVGSPAGRLLSQFFEDLGGSVLDHGDEIPPEANSIVCIEDGSSPTEMSIEVRRNLLLVRVALSAFGSIGSLAGKQATEAVIQGAVGLASTTGLEGQGPCLVPLPISALAGALTALHAVLAVLLKDNETATQREWKIDVSLSDALSSMWSTNAAEWLATGRLPKPVGVANPNRCPGGLFKTADGWIEILAFSEKHWRELCKALDLTEFEAREDLRLNEGRLQFREEIDSTINAATEKALTKDLEARLASHGIPVASIQGLEEIFSDEGFIERGIVRPKCRAIVTPFALLAHA